MTAGAQTGLGVLTIAEAGRCLREGTLTSAELVEDALAAIDSQNETIAAVLSRYDESARRAAAATDEALAAGDPVGPLGGIPLVIKDILDASEGPTTAQSLVHDDAERRTDAGSVARLRAAGAVILGKASTMEFAVGTPDPAKPFAAPRNPWDTAYWPGGSSSGTAAAISSGMALGGLGTDTGGSIRMPSSFCGTTGLKPTYGRVSKTGCVPLAFSMDHVGPMARSAEDCALLLSAIAGYDDADPTTAAVDVPEYAASLTPDLAGLRIGVDDSLRRPGPGVDDAALAAFERALDELRQLGAEILDVELPYREELDIAHGVILDSEALAYHLPNLRTRWDDYTASTRLRAASGAYYSAADYVQAQRIRRAAQRALAGLFRHVDAVVSPFAPLGGIPLAELGVRLEQWIALMDAGYWDAAGNPALVVPHGFASNGLPVGMQICGRPFDEATVLRVGYAYQQSTDWHLRRPPAAGWRRRP